MRLSQLISDYLRDHLPNQRGLTANTCETYAHSYKLFFNFVADRQNLRPSQLMLQHINAPNVLEFLEHIERKRGNGSATRNLRLAAIKSFLRYVEHRDPSVLEQSAQVQAIPTKRGDVPLIEHLSIEEVHALLNAPDMRTYSGIRDRAMMHLCFAAGLRVSELVGTQIVDLKLGAKPALTIYGKGRRERALPLWQETAKDLRAWIKVRGNALTNDVFLNARGERMSRSGFEYVLDKHVRSASKTCPSLIGRSVSPHQLRHSCALVMLEATKDVRKVALWLGHADVRTTETYLRMDASQKLEAIESVVPPSLRPGRFKPPDALIAMLSDVAE